MKVWLLIREEGTVDEGTETIILGAYRHFSSAMLAACTQAKKPVVFKEVNPMLYTMELSKFVSMEVKGLYIND